MVAIEPLGETIMRGTATETNIAKLDGGMSLLRRTMLKHSDGRTWDIGKSIVCRCATRDRMRVSMMAIYGRSRIVAPPNLGTTMAGRKSRALASR